MSPPTEWGPPVWILFHTLAEKINPDKFSVISQQLFFFIKRICASLPCPECSQHAVAFLGKVNFSNIKTKTDLQNILYIFHNVVNKRKNKAVFNRDTVSAQYANNNMINVYNKFVNILMLYKKEFEEILNTNNKQDILKMQNLYNLKPGKKKITRHKNELDLSNVK